MTSINLRGNGLGDDGASLLAVAVEMRECPLVDLNLWSNDITDAGAHKLADALAVNTSLTHLDLSGNNIGSDGADALAEACAQNRTLASVDLRNNDFDSCDPKRYRLERRRPRPRPGFISRYRDTVRQKPPTRDAPT